MQVNKKNDGNEKNWKMIQEEKEKTNEKKTIGCDENRENKR